MHRNLRGGGVLQHRAGTLNREGFPRGAVCDSPCLEVEHGQSLFGRSSGEGGEARRRWRIASGGRASLRGEREHGGAGGGEPGEARHAGAAQAGAAAGTGQARAHLGFLVEIVEAVPDITMPELAGALEAEHGVRVHPSSISRVLIRAGMSYKNVLPAPSAS